uniref:Reverse transcriptase domain-containing protein n=1 Tax=Magallana gigas TaxID=29159 RepID=A0A8W8ISZ1_MAGGI
MSPEDREILRTSLEKLRMAMVQKENYSPTMLPVNILTGLSDAVISNIVSNAHYFNDPADLYAKFKPHLRPEWTPEVKLLHDRERQMRNIWLIEGRPRGMVHDSYKNYKKAKREFRNELNAEHDRYMTSENSRLQTLSKLPGGEVTAIEISKAIKELKRRKAPGLDCIQNEHLIFGGPQLFTCISHLFNAVINIGRIPSIWKTDLIIPIYKGNNKTKSSPDSYRPIALLPCLMKLFEKTLTLRIRDHVLPSVSFPNPQQQGFQLKLGCITASFNLQETVFHNLEQGSPVYVAFLDTQKAFDTVWRHGLMCKLHQLGVKGSLWTLIDDCHTDTFCSVAVNQKNSSWFPISQGVRQGGVLSTFLYLVFINDLLQELQNQNPNTGIHSIRSSNPALADDISCISLSPRGHQTLLNTAYDFSTQWRFKFNASKSNVLHFSPTDINNSSLSWKLGDGTIKISKSYNNLGILLDAKLDPTERTAKACRKGQQTYFALKMSEHLNPATLSKLYKRIVLPSVLYGSELWCDLKQKDNRALDVFQHFICKHAMNLPKHTRSDMCESIFGLLPIASEIDKRKLQFFGRLCLMDTKCLTKKIFLHRLFSYLDSPNCKHYGFIPDVIHLLDKYNLLEHLNSYLQNGLFLNKLEWKKTVNSAVFYHFTTSRSNRMLQDNDFTQSRHITGNSRPDWIWKIPSEIQEVTLCARSLPGLSFTDFSYSLHLLNFRLIRDAAACYYRMSRATSCRYT